jgi:hypothetical protein
LFRLLLWLCKVLLKTVLLAAIYQFLEFWMLIERHILQKLRLFKVWCDNIYLVHPFGCVELALNVRTDNHIWNIELLSSSAFSPVLRRWGRHAKVLVLVELAIIDLMFRRLRFVVVMNIWLVGIVHDILVLSIIITEEFLILHLGIGLFQVS